MDKTLNRRRVTRVEDVCIRRNPRSFVTKFGDVVIMMILGQKIHQTLRSESG